MLDGKATTLAGAVAKGRTLTMRLTKRTPDFLRRTTDFCAVPRNLPVDPEGASAPLPSAAPYYVAEYVPGERLVLERNRFYNGPRRTTSTASSPTWPSTQTRSSTRSRAASSTGAGVGSDIAERERRARAALRRQQVRRPVLRPAGFFLRMFVLNTSRPLFKNNPKLRQAVNFAVDRRALTRELGRSSARPPTSTCRPSCRASGTSASTRSRALTCQKRKALAKGTLRGGKAVLYTTETSGRRSRRGRSSSENLEAIGLEVEIKQFPAPARFREARHTRRAIRHRLDRLAVIADRSCVPRHFFDGRTIGEPEHLQLLVLQLAEVQPAARRGVAPQRRDALPGLRRARRQLSRDAAPAIPFAVLNALTFVSARVGCVVLNPYLDLTAVCLK